MDQLIIKNLELFGFHGVHPEEQTMGQKFIVDARISLDLSKAGDTDSLETAINYAELCHELQDVFNVTKHQLIERAASVLCEYILTHYPAVKDVDLTLKKPWAPIHLPIDYPAIRLVRRWHTAYIALGSNLGDKQKNIDDALLAIDRLYHTSIIKCSSFIETDPVGYEDQDTFINGVVEIKTLLSPENLIRWLLSIESDLKRERLVRWGPRTIDLDIIYYDDIVTGSEEIVLPHPRMHERAFVLIPLNEIAPYKIHPILNKRTFQLLKDLKTNNFL